MIFWVANQALAHYKHYKWVHTEPYKTNSTNCEKIIQAPTLKKVDLSRRLFFFIFVFSILKYNW